MSSPAMLTVGLLLRRRPGAGAEEEEKEADATLLLMFDMSELYTSRLSPGFGWLAAPGLL